MPTPKKSLKDEAAILRVVRSNQPRATLRDAQIQADRVTEAGRLRKPLSVEDICDAEDAVLLHAVVKATARDLAQMK